MANKDSIKATSNWCSIISFYLAVLDAISTAKVEVLMNIAQDNNMW